MRTKKASINILFSILSYVISTIPVFLVRKVFLDTLGSELLGLNSLFSNILSYLSIVEMGIGSAIIFSLYRPYAENDQVKVKGYLQYYSKFYKIVGTTILVIGLLLVPGLDIFIKEQVNLFDAKMYFILFLINTVITYYFSYKLCILNVAQEGYKISIAMAISKLVISTLQIIFLKLNYNMYVYLLIQIIINLFYYLIINKYISVKYEWLEYTEGKINYSEKENLKKRISALFMHKIGNVIVFGTDNIVISYFINLNTVSKYNSYIMIINAFKNIIENMMNSITPSIGNLLVMDDKNKAYEVHKKLFFMSFWIVSTIVILLYNVITQFVQIWLDESQVLSKFTVAIILFNLYFQLMRSSVERFKEGSGNYHQDKYSAFIEAIINLIFSILLVKKIGLPGVFIGTLISNIMVVFWMKPLITYKYVFNKSVIEYFVMYFRFLIIGITTLFITTFITKGLVNYNNIYMFSINCVINILVVNIIYLIIFWKNKEFIFYKNLIKEFIIKVLKNKLSRIPVKEK